jgi:hypothetical protein
MEQNDWILACWILSTLLCLLGRRWLDASPPACFAVFMILDRVPPTTIPPRLKYVFLVIGLAFIFFDIFRNYARYKKKLAAK